MIYGMGVRALGEQLGVEEDEARTLLDQFQSSFPGVQKFARAMVEAVRSTNYVTTLLGRRRYLPDINSHCSQARGKLYKGPLWSLWLCFSLLMSFSLKNKS